MPLFQEPCSCESITIGSDSFLFLISPMYTIVFAGLLTIRPSTISVTITSSFGTDAALDLCLDIA